MERFVQRLLDFLLHMFYNLHSKRKVLQGDAVQKIGQLLDMRTAAQAKKLL